MTMKNSNNKITMVVFLAMIMAIGIFVSLAQTKADTKYMRQAQKTADSLFREAKIYYNENVKPLEQSARAQRNNIPITREQLLNEYDSLKIDSIRYEAMLKDTVNLYRIENIINNEIATDVIQFNQQVSFYVDTLRNYPCNPLAIKEVAECESFLSDKYKPYFHQNFDPLLNYEKYCLEIKAPLDSIYEDLLYTNWKALDSTKLAIFDEAWGKVSYLTLKDEDRIPYLDKLVVQISNLRDWEFENCGPSFTIITENLTPQVYDVPSRPAILDNISRYSVLSHDIDSAKTKLEKDIRPRMNNIWDYFDENGTNGQIAQKLYNATYQWYLMREDLDKHLISMCRHCLSQPCDANYQWLRKNIESNLDSVFHDSYIVCINNYRNLLNNYDKYTKEIYDFLRDKEGYTNLNGTNFSGTTYATQLQNDFDNLSYVRLYYKQYLNNPNDPKGVYSPYLNNVLQQFEALWRRNFAHSKSDYEKLKESVDISNQVVTPPSNRHNNRGHHQPELNNGDNDETTGDPDMNPAPNQQPQTPGTEPEKPNMEPDKPKQAPDDPIQFQA